MHPIRLLLSLSLVFGGLFAPTHLPSPSPQLVAAEATAPMYSSANAFSYHVPAESISFRSEEDFSLSPIFQDYVSAPDYIAFSEQYTFDGLLAAGVEEAYSLLPPHREPPNSIGGSVLVVSTPNTQNTVSGYSVGTPMAQIESHFGAADFTVFTALGEVPSLGYKTASFYVAFVGGITAEHLLLARRQVNTSGYKALLPDLLAGKEKTEDVLQAVPLRSSHFRHGFSIYYGENGFTSVHTGEDKKIFEIYNDYEGLAPIAPRKSPEGSDEQPLLPNVSFVQHPTDFPHNKINLVYQYVLDPALDLQEEPLFSPEDDITIFPFTSGVYEDSGLLVRFQDKRVTDRFYYYGHFPHLEGWFTPHIAAISTMLGCTVTDFAEQRTLLSYEGKPPEIHFLPEENRAVISPKYGTESTVYSFEVWRNGEYQLGEVLLSPNEELHLFLKKTENGYEFVYSKQKKPPVPINQRLRYLPY